MPIKKPTKQKPILFLPSRKSLLFIMSIGLISLNYFQAIKIYITIVDSSPEPIEASPTSAHDVPSVGIGNVSGNTTFHNSTSDADSENKKEVEVKENKLEFYVGGEKKTNGTKLPRYYDLDDDNAVVFPTTAIQRDGKLNGTKQIQIENRNVSITRT